MGETPKAMDRRSFLAAGALAAASSATSCGPGAPPDAGMAAPRSPFPRADAEVFLNAAGGMPLSTFAERGLSR